MAIAVITQLIVKLTKKMCSIAAKNIEVLATFVLSPHTEYVKKASEYNYVYSLELHVKTS